VISNEAVLFQIPSYFPSIHEPFEKPVNLASKVFCCFNEGHTWL